jgi:hypothetical protein
VVPDPRDFQPRPAKVLRSGAITTAEVVFEKGLDVPDPLRQEATDRLRTELGLLSPAGSPGQRLLRVRFLSLEPATFTRPDLAGEWIVSTLAGACLGAYAGGVGAIVGGGIGIVAGPFVWTESRKLHQRLGYLPWNWTAELEILAVDGIGEKLLTRKAIHLSPKPVLEALPPEGAKDPLQVRRATVRGVLVAFAKETKNWHPD